MDRQVMDAHSLIINNQHELFCATVVCFLLRTVHSVTKYKDNSEGVLLLIMNVSSYKRGISVTVFWDLGSSSNFVLDSNAKKSGFEGREEHLSVTTLVGVTTNYYTVNRYLLY